MESIAKTIMEQEQQDKTFADIDELKAALDDSSDKNRGFLIAFFILEIYLLVTVLGTTDVNLFLADSVFNFPFIELEVSLVAFFIIAPLVLVAFHYNLLFNLLEHMKILHDWLEHPDNDRKANFNLLPPFMFNIRAKYDEYEDTPRGSNYYLVNAIIIFTVSLSPLGLVLLILWKFAAFQSWWISAWHLLVLLGSLYLHIIYWLRIQNKHLLEPKFEHFNQILYELKNNGYMSAYLLAILLFALVRLGALSAALSAPETLGKKMDSPFVAFLVPHIDVSTEQFDQRIPEAPLLSVEMAKTPHGVVIEPIEQCPLNIPYEQTDLSGRHLALANLSQVNLCNGLMQHTVLRGAKIRKATLSGQFDLADFSGADLSHTQIQQNTTMMQTRFNGADLSYVKADRVNFTLADFSDAKLWATQLLQGEFLQSRFNRAEFTLVQADYANFRSVDFADARFTQTHLHGVDLRFAKNFDYSVTFHNTAIKDCFIDDINVLKAASRYLGANCEIYTSRLLDEGSNDVRFVKMLQQSFRANETTKFISQHKSDVDLMNRIIDVAQTGKAQQLNLANFALNNIPGRITALKKLQNLNLGYNHLDNEQLLLTTLMTQLKTLALNANNISVIPKEIAQLQQLQRLNLSANTIKTLPEALLDLHDLQELKLNNNRIAELPKHFGQLTQLHDLNLAYNSITQIPQSIAALTQLKKLNLKSNLLETLPEDIASLAALEELNLIDNLLNEFPLSLVKLHQLNRLMLRGNGVDSLPSSVGQLQQLRFVDLGANQITSLPQEFANLQQLQSVLLQGNRLTSIPTELTQLPNLHTLALSSNQITQWSLSNKQFQALKHLSLDGNQLTELPNQIGSLIQLQALDLAGNQLVDITPSIGQLNQLSSLNLSRNRLSHLPSSLSQLSQLNIIDLSQNQFGTLPTTLAKVQSLQKLDLSHNRLSHVPRRLTGFTQLSELDLSHNQLTQLPEALIQLPSLKNLKVTNNQLIYPPQAVADRGLEAIREWFEEYN